MAGTTSNYGWSYPTSTDLVRNGASAIQTLASSIDSFIGGSSGTGKLINHTTQSVAGTGTRGAASFAALGANPNKITNWQLGPSGVLAVYISGICWNTNNGSINYISADVSGAITAGAAFARSAAVTGVTATTKTGVGFWSFFDGTPNGLVTVEIQGYASAGQLNVDYSNITLVSIG